MITEGDFVPGVAKGQTNAESGTDYDFFDFPTIGDTSTTVSGGNIVVMFKDSPAAQALVEYLASPEAGEIWAKRGGFSSPNKNVPESAYTDPIFKRAATGISQSESLVFDMSDMAPGAFAAVGGVQHHAGLPEEPERHRRHDAEARGRREEALQGLHQVTSTSASPVGEVPRVPPAPRAGLWSRDGTALVFLAPAIIFLIVWYVYPTIYTVWRSFKSADGGTYVGLDNYKEIFTDDVLFTAIRNNAIWVAVVPASVTALGLVFAVLVERISWSTAFKFAVFAPLAISLFAAGVIWRSTMYNKDPEIGTINAVLGAVQNTVNPTGVLADANPSTDDLQPAGGGLELAQPVEAGGTALMGLTAISEDEVPRGAEQAAQPEAASRRHHRCRVAGLQARRRHAGRVESEELGLPGVKVELRDTSGNQVGSADTENDGSFRFEELEGSGPYTVAIAAETFAEPFQGVTWLGSKLITPSLIIAYLWTAAGFAMVVIGAGLASLPRDVLEAARTDGATEFQVFRRVTVPLLKPVLLVVFITQIIGVLKVFDIILSIAPGSVWNDATVLAFEMWRQSFQFNNFGVGAALAVFLFLLVIPIIILNIRNFRREL